MYKTFLVCVGQSHSNQLSWMLRGQFLEPQANSFYLEVSCRTLRSVLTHSDQFLGHLDLFWSAHYSVLEQTGTS
jgi:hypothetical protein